MSIHPANIDRCAALETARSLIGHAYVSSPVQADCFNGWTFIAKCFGGRAPSFVPGWGPRDRWMAMGQFFNRGMKLTTLAAAQPGDVLVFDMGRDGHHAGVVSETGGAEPKMISCQFGKAASQCWLGRSWTDRVVGVFTYADAAVPASNDNAQVEEAA